VSTTLAPIEPAIRFLRANRWARGTLSVVSLGLLVAAVAMLSYPLYTNYESSRRQARLDREFASPDLRDDYVAGAVVEGDPLTRIKIPALDVDTIVVEGTGASALKAGAGHYPASPLPCEDGNVAIAGHRTTYGRPFANIDRLAVGDQVILQTPIGSCTYEVFQIGPDAPFRIVVPTDFSVVENSPGDPKVTLTSCHPKGSARQRIIVQAKLVAQQPEPA
jgi:sortase A